MPGVMGDWQTVAFERCLGCGIHVRCTRAGAERIHCRLTRRLRCSGEPQLMCGCFAADYMRIRAIEPIAVDTPADIHEGGVAGLGRAVARTVWILYDRAPR